MTKDYVLDDRTWTISDGARRMIATMPPDARVTIVSAQGVFDMDQRRQDQHNGHAGVTPQPIRAHRSVSARLAAHNRSVRRFLAASPDLFVTTQAQHPSVLGHGEA
jgi:hypothetical protein